MKHVKLIKHSGQVFTPARIVELMLDYCGYTGAKIIERHIIDNSCGDGAFLCNIVQRYCEEFLSNSPDKQLLKIQLETFIHGIEMDSIAYDNCIFNLNTLMKEYRIFDVKWDVKNSDALLVKDYNGKMDFVVGNPPYVRVHNLEDNYKQVKTFRFANGGMTDLYLVFFELGFSMLRKNGKLCYITPGSWLSSLAAATMRRYLFNNKILAGLIDLEHFQAFENATTYTLISLFENENKKNTVEYYTYNDKAIDNKKFIDHLSFEDIFIGNKLYIAEKKQLEEIRKIKSYNKNKFCIVKNGFATLSDKVFIGELPFQQLTIPVIKASTGKWSKCFFPYNSSGKAISKESVFENEQIAAYLGSKKNVLLKGKPEEQNPHWYLFGRTQALKDVFVDKIAVNTIIIDLNSIKLNFVPAGSGVYSGLYILTKLPFGMIKDIIVCNDFINYLSVLKNYKSGGYYTFNSKDLEQYINYKISLLSDEYQSKFFSTDEYRASQYCT